MDSKRLIEALPRASNPKPKSTLLVHPFTDNSEKPKNYLLETPKDLKRRAPLLELPASYKKPKLYSDNVEIEVETEMKTAGNCETESGKEKNCHCCCKCSKEESEVKVIIAPAMMPSIFGALPGIPYIVKGKIEKVGGHFLI